MLFKVRVFGKWLVLVALAFGVTACVVIQKAQSPERVSTAPEGLDVGVLMIGDSGNIEAEQSTSGLIPVSSAIKLLCEKKPCDFGVMAGDNIYPMGADAGPLDAGRFKRAFENPFGSLMDRNADFRIYMALGNHDWYNSRAGAMAQVAYAQSTPPMSMKGLFYSVKPPAANGAVEVFVIDTEMLLAATTIDYYKLDDDGIPYATGKSGNGGHRNAAPQTPEEKNQLAWLRQAMKSSDARWKLVLAHHPLWESRGSKHQESIVLRDILRPLVCEYADAYIAGHQHTLEVHTDNCDGAGRDRTFAPLIHLISGAAGKSRALNPDYMRWQSQQFSSLNSLSTIGDMWGYMHGTIQGDRFTVDVYAAKEGDAQPENSVVQYSRVFEKK